MKHISSLFTFIVILFGCAALAETPPQSRPRAGETIRADITKFGGDGISVVDPDTSDPSILGRIAVGKVVAGDERAGRTVLSFDDAAVGGIPDGWAVEGTNQRGPEATWRIKAEPDAPSQPNVLALTDAKEGWGGTFNLLWTDRMKFKDGVIEVMVKAETGREDQGGGLIWRVQDKDNYYIARWNPLEDNFRVYSVKDGRRKILESARVKADPSKWHTIRIEHTGDEIRCYFDDEALKTVRDNTFPAGGGVGVWTKADAVTAFDDFEVKGRLIPDDAP